MFIASEERMLEVLATRLGEIHELIQKNNAHGALTIVRNTLQTLLDTPVSRTNTEIEVAGGCWGNLKRLESWLVDYECALGRRGAVRERDHEYEPVDALTAECDSLKEGTGQFCMQSIQNLCVKVPRARLPLSVKKLLIRASDQVEPPRDIDERINELHKRLQEVYGDSLRGGPVLCELGEALCKAHRYREALGRYEAGVGHLRQTGQPTFYEEERIRELKDRLAIMGQPS